MNGTGFRGGLYSSSYEDDGSWGRWSGGYHRYGLWVFLFVERGISDAVGVIDVSVRGGTSGVVGRHVGFTVGVVLWLFGSLLIL